MITITFNQAQLAAIHQVDVNLRQASPEIRRKLLSRLSRKVIDYSQGHTEAQTDISGQPYAPHKRSRARKMLTRLSKRLKITSLLDSEAVIGFNNAMEGIIGYRQQYGYKQKHTASELTGGGTFEGRVSLNSNKPRNPQTGQKPAGSGL